MSLRSRALRSRHETPLAVALAAGFALCAPAVRAQDPVSSALDREVVKLVALRWHTPPACVRLLWRADAVGRSTAPRLAPDEVSSLGIIPHPGGWFTVIVTGDSLRPAVRLAVRAGIADSLLVARRALPRGTVLAPADVADTVVVRWGAPAATSIARPAPGWTTRRIINAGEPLRPPAVAPPVLIAGGDSVDLIVHAGDVELTLRGVALERAAAVGDRVDVRLDDRRLIHGIAAGPHTVNAPIR